jgi:hypothetical protein
MSRSRWGSGKKRGEAGETKVRFSGKEGVPVPENEKDIVEELGTAKEEVWSTFLERLDKKMGTGSFSCVLSRDDWRWVFRVSEVPTEEESDTKHLKRARTQLRMQKVDMSTMIIRNWGMCIGEGRLSSILPRVAVQKMFNDDRIHVCVMERLTPIEVALRYEDSVGCMRHPKLFAEAIVRFLACYSGLFAKNAFSHWDLQVGNIMVRELTPQERITLRIGVVPVAMDLVFPAGPSLVMVDLDSCLHKNEKGTMLVSAALGATDYYKPFTCATGACGNMLVRMFLCDSHSSRAIWRIKGNRVARPLLASMLSVFAEWFPESCESFDAAIKELGRGIDHCNMSYVIDLVAAGLLFMDVHLFMVKDDALLSAEEAVDDGFVLWEMRHGFEHDKRARRSANNFFKVWCAELAGCSCAKIMVSCGFFFEYERFLFAESKLDYFNVRVLGVARRLGVRVEAATPVFKSALQLSSDEASSEGGGMEGD